MPSFEFADCPTRLDLAVAAGTQEQTGSIGCTLRNTTTKRQTARIRVEPLGSAKPGWFQLAGAPATSPLEIEEDIAAGGTLTVQVAARIPPGTPAGSGTFRLRVTSEAAPDTDFAEGPAVAFEIAAAAAPQTAPAKARFPWWAIAVAALFLVMVIGAVAFLAWPASLDPKLVIGKKLADAKKIAAEHGFADVQVVSGDAWGNNPADRIVVGFEPAAPRFEVDDGVKLPPDILNRPFAEAAQIMLDRGVIPSQSVLGQIGGPEGRVMITAPPPGVPIALGTPIITFVGARPFPPVFMAGQFPCQALPGTCGVQIRAYTVDDLNAVARDRLKNKDQMVDLILRGQ